MLALSILAPFTIIGLIALLIASTKENTKEGDDTMRNIYIYLVLFATLMMVIGGSVSVFMTLTDIVSPEPYYQSFEEYRQYGKNYDNEKVANKSEEELRASYDSMVEHDAAQAKRRSVNVLIKSFGWIIIPLPIFLYFQRQVRVKKQ